MRILRVIASLQPYLGGPVEAARTLDMELGRLGHEVEVTCLDEPNEDFHDAYPATVHALGPSHLQYCFNSRLLPWLRANRQRFDAVIVDGLWQYSGFGVWRALSGSPTPYFVFAHGALSPWFKRRYPFKHLKKWAYWPWAEYRVLRDACAVLFTCEEERRLARKSFWLYKCNEAVLRLGILDPLTDERLAVGKFLDVQPVLRGKRILFFLGRMHEVKGCDLLIRAFAQVAQIDPRLHLVMAGPDQTGWTATLQQQAAILGLSDRITWTGMLRGDEKWGGLYSAEVFCLPSHQENFGVVVAEALACGKPVLISNRVNIWREIEADGAGIVRDDTLEGTVEGLKQWLALAPVAKQKMRHAARQCFEARFRSDRAAGSLIRILQKHVGTKTSVRE